MAKRRQVARSTERKVPTKPKRAPADVDQKKQIATLKRELAKALERQTAASEVLQVISSTPGDLEPVFAKMLENATRICGANFGQMNLYEDGSFRLVALYNVPAAYATSLAHTPFQPHPQGGLGTVVRTRRVVHIEDIRTLPPYLEGNPSVVALADLAGARSVFVAPMLKENELIGAITIYRRQVKPFTERQTELVANFANQAVIAIENTRLLGELRVSLQQQTATADVLKVISRSAFDLQTVLETLVRSAAELSGSKRGVIFLRDGDLFRFKAMSYADANPDWINFLKEHPQKAGQNSAIARAISSGQIVYVPDVLADAQIDMPATALAGIRAVLAVPLLRDGKVEGVMALSRSTPGTFDVHQIDLVQTFADQALIAIENVRLFDEVQARTEDLRESLQFQTATSDVLKVISSSPDALQPVLDVIVETSRELCASEASTIFLLRYERFHLTALSGAEPPHIAALRTSPISIDEPGSVLPRAVREKRTLHFPNIADDPEFKDGIVGRGGPRALLVVPLILEDQVIGAIVLRKSHLTPFTERQIEVVQTFADQAVIAISNVRLFEQVQERTRELSASLDDLRTAQDRLVQTEKLASLGQLTAGIAHEIKNPLNFVNNFSTLSKELVDELGDALKPVDLDDKKREGLDELMYLLKGNLEKVVQHGQRADSIVKNMLLHSREGSGERRPVDLNAIVEDSLNLAYHGARAEKKEFNIRLERSFDPAAGTVDLFPQEITRVLLNLISNGVYAAMKRKAEMKDGYEPTLAAATGDLGDHVEIRIRDNGGGIPQGIKEKIFNPFFTTKPPGEGTGLGLSLSYDIIVKQHSGSIEVDTQPGEFSEFRVILPRKAALRKPE
jgi:two-component system NtrC family sensor kinase